MPEEPPSHRLRQAGHHLIHTEPGSDVEAGDQVGVLGVEPGHGFRGIGRKSLVTVQEGQHPIVGDRMRQVVPQHTVQGRVRLRLLIGGEIRGVPPDQVVQPVPPRRGLLYQMRVHQVFQHRTDADWRHCRKRASHRAIKVSAWQHTQQPEHAALVRIELLQRHAEHGVIATGVGP
jgi:hypothetical protein